MNHKHLDFYEMVKDWTVSDFRTPGIKAEVIVDMLLSDFIDDLIRYHYCDSEQSDVKLLTKELPIKALSMKEQSKETNRNAKVDYLVSVGNAKLILVELKTTNDSFDKTQKKRMEKAVETGPENLMEFYNKIANLAKGNTLDRKKYQNVFKQYQEILQEANLNGQAFRELDYLYVSLTDSRKLPEEKKLILEDYCTGGMHYQGFCNWLLNEENGEERRQLWDKISDILFECAKKLGSE